MTAACFGGNVDKKEAVELVVGIAAVLDFH